MTHKFRKFLDNRRKRLENILNKQLTIITRGSPKKFANAMQYVVLNGGKRIRPLLLYAVGETYNIDPNLLDASACAIEMIHSFSLVHDDLPAMDNDSLRRGKPTCHLAFDEATAILAGDTLAIGAFQVLSADKNLSPEKKLLMIDILAKASGAHGMAGGQYLDLHPSNKPSKHKLEQMYLLKTGALISAAVKLAASATSIKKRELDLLEKFALNIGLAFQIQDDILNIEGQTKKLGKNIGTDLAQNKITYPTLVASKIAKVKINNLWQDSQKILLQLKINDAILRDFTNYVMHRDF